jgi:adenylate cyclase
MPKLSLSLLGPVQITCDGEEPVKFRTSKAQALLIYLTMKARPPADKAVSHQREALMELLWPGAALSSAQDNLRQTLYQLRRAIPTLPTNEGAATESFLITSHQTVQLNPNCLYDLDVTAFEQLTVDPQLPENLQKAVSLYRDDFLNDFYLADSVQFEEWASAQRAHLQRRCLEALSSLISGLIARANYEQAQFYARRQLEIDGLREVAHRHLMRALALDGQRSAALAQYETCQQLLRAELDIEPSAETAALYDLIRTNQLVTPMPATSLSTASLAPAFLQIDASQTGPAGPVFVARQRELDMLDGFLAESLHGQGRVVFVIGSAGRGKTALLSEFSRRAMVEHAELIVARGNCNAYSGLGDPYLPFRDIMDMMTGDVEAGWAAGAISQEHARRLWRTVPYVIESLLAFGPDLVDIFVPGSTLLFRAAQLNAADSSWYLKLQALIQRQDTIAGFEQGQLFQQFSNLLSHLAERYPILLVLDDVQWADLASISLLFHLGRRITHSRIMLACAYRPDEVALGRDGQRHPLEQALAEFKRQFGDVWIDLASDREQEGHQFVQALLETQPNRLGPAFREALAQHTQGHPLFTIELLREMRERGDLTQDEAGYWISGPSLDWQTLPARVEAVIGERIGRLDDELREILAVASIEGESFTAQVIARVLGISDRQMLRILGQQLERRHRLVREQAERQVGAQRLSRFRFAHALFQQYLYNSLGSGEVRLLHREIAGVLEDMYAGREELIAVQLARHYAGDAERERHYSRIAGERAAKQFANDEAINHLGRAIELTADSDQRELYDLLVTREPVYDVTGNREAQSLDLKTMERLVEELDDGGQAGLIRRARLALRQANYAQNISDFATAVKATRTAINLARSAGDVSTEAAGHLQWGEGLWRMGKFESCRLQLEQALRLARQAGSRQLEADGLRLLGNVYYYMGDYTPATDYYAQGLSLSRQIGDRSGEASALSNLGEAARSQGDYANAREYYLQRLRICREIGERVGENIALNNLGLISHNLGDNEAARDYCHQALLITQDIGNRSFQAYNLTTLAHTQAGLGLLPEAVETYRKAVGIRHKLGEVHLAMESIAGLARTLLLQGNLAQALDQVEQILLYLKTGTLDGTDEPLRVYLTCYQVLSAANDARATTILDAAYQLLVSRADQIVDGALRRSYLENVAAHAQIMKLWRAARDTS